jgi:hypothetical protein
VTRSELIRNRIAPVAFGIAIVLMARQSCQKEQRMHATVVLEPGAAEHEIRSVEADVWANDAQLSQFRRNAPDGGYIGPMRFDAPLTEKDAELHLDVDLGARGHRVFVRHVHAEEAATVTVPLESDLR